MSAGQFCNRDIVIARKEDSIVHAAQRMRSHHAACVVVVEEDGHGAVAPVGIVTDRDLVIEVLAKGLDAGQTVLGDILSYELVTAHEDDRLWDTLQRMRVKSVRSVAVVDRHGVLKGLLSSDDLLAILSGEMHELARLVQHDQCRELKPRAAG